MNALGIGCGGQFGTWPTGLIADRSVKGRDEGPKGGPDRREIGILQSERAQFLAGWRSQGFEQPVAGFGQVAKFAFVPFRLLAQQADRGARGSAPGVEWHLIRGRAEDNSRQGG